MQKPKGVYPQLVLWKQTLIAMLHVDATELLRCYPGPEYLCRADARDIVSMMRIPYTQVRKLIRFSNRYLGEWSDLSELPGVTKRVLEALDARKAS